MKQGISQKEIGKRIRQLRKQAELRVVELAAAVQVSRQHIYDIEGGNKGLTLKRLQQISHALKVDIAVLLQPRRRGKVA